MEKEDCYNGNDSCCLNDINFRWSCELSMDKKQIDKLLEELDYYKQVYEELNLIIDTTFDFISVADEKGIFIRVSKGSDKVFMVPDEQIIGASCYDVEERGIVDSSVTRMVLETGKKASSIQSTRGGKRFMVIGVPMFDDKGNLKRIINISRDITEIEKLNSRLKETEELLDWYHHEMIKNQEFEKNFIYSETSSMKKIFNLINQVSNVDATVLLLGETGVGKNLIAKTIHQLSNRRGKPFVQINCGAIPENLLESELFGYVEGAFTGAIKGGKKGFFEIANDGTIFLDEIAEIPIYLQVKLLHALENHEIYKVGSSNSTRVNARILAATNKDLKEMVRDGKFREDLYYRLNVLPIFIPPLRDRQDDIPLLTHYFLNKYNNKYCMNKQLTTEAYRALSQYQWPGNIRELENVIERLVITCDQDIVDVYHVHSTVYGPSDKKVIQINGIMPLKQAVERVEKELLFKALEEFKTTREVAKVLEIDQSTVVKKMNKFKRLK